MTPLAFRFDITNQATKICAIHAVRLQIPLLSRQWKHARNKSSSKDHGERKSPVCRICKEVLKGNSFLSSPAARSIAHCPWLRALRYRLALRCLYTLSSDVQDELRTKVLCEQAKIINLHHQHVEHKAVHHGCRDFRATTQSVEGVRRVEVASNQFFTPNLDFGRLQGKRYPAAGR